MADKDNRVSELDALRGIAAMCVVLFHFTAKYRQFFGYNFSSRYDFDAGHYGVELFFVISGFVIFMTLKKVKSVGDFGFKRFSRLFPTYWICIIITSIVIVLFGLPDNGVTTKQVLINFTMFQGLLHVKSVDGAYWSLLPEILFYFMMGFLFQFKLLNRINVVGSIWLLIIIINKFYKLELLNTLLNLRYGMFFFSGILFYKLKFKANNAKLNHLLIAMCAITAVIVDFSLEYSVVVGIIFCTFYLFSYGKLFFISIKPLLFLGYISYPLYLVHQNIGYIIILKLKYFHLSEFLRISIAMVIVIILAWLITVYLEKPILKFLRKRGNSKSAGPPEFVFSNDVRNSN